MTQKLKTIIFATALTALAACSDDVATGRYSVGEEDNLVRLTTGVENAPSAAMQSRADVSAATHYALQTGTALNLYVEGEWTNAYGTTNDITKTPIYKAGDPSGNFINPVQYDATYNSTKSTLYWDDFGTADPANTANRAKGLGILAVAIDGITNTTVVNLGSKIDWNNFKLDWNLEDYTGTIQVGGTKFLKQDILVANNLYDASVTTPQKRYTFDEQKNIKANPIEDNKKEARLDFKHVLSKITFNVTAGNGFNGTFLYEPNITLTRNKTGETNPEWCYKNGTIDIKTATATHNGTLGTVELNSISKSGSTYTESAVIYPNSDFGSDTDIIIARISADFNIYYVTAAQIRDAIDALGASHEHYGSYKTKPGYHYIFNVTLNKTDIVVTATITDWKTVTATEDIPEILPMATISWGNGHGTATDLKEFEFYSSYAKNDSYSDLATAKCNAGADSLTTWTFYDASGVKKKLYWPSHNTHLFFRGISPSSTTVNGQKEIVISNAPYTKGTNAANLLIGMPEIASGTMCENPDHTAVDMSVYGICARKEPINLNFRYMMSQVEVILNTTSGADKVAIGENTVVEITNAYSSGVVSLGTREVTVSGSTGNYTLDADAVETDADKKKLQRRSAIVPQPLEGLKFKVTVTNDNGTKDVYYSTIKDILVESNTITKWEPGYHYKYTLTLKKTGISVTATITDWIPANGSDNVWM